MTQTSRLIEAIKKELKTQGITYFDVAESLNLSEATIKRMFSQQQLSIKRLDKLCDLINMDFNELVSSMKSDDQIINQLSVEQETILVNDDKLLFVLISVLNRMTFQQMHDAFVFSEKQLIGYLKQLEGLKLIALLPNDRIRLLISHNFNWLPSGPIHELITRKVKEQFFDTNFDNQDEKMHLLSASLSSQSIAILQNQMDRLIDLFLDLEKKDVNQSANINNGMTMLVAIRPWDFKGFDKFRKQLEK